jgi:hypothetical protein
MHFVERDIFPHVIQKYTKIRQYRPYFTKVSNFAVKLNLRCSFSPWCTMDFAILKFLNFQSKGLKSISPMGLAEISQMT